METTTSPRQSLEGAPAHSALYRSIGRLCDQLHAIEQELQALGEEARRVQIDHEAASSSGDDRLTIEQVAQKLGLPLDSGRAPNSLYSALQRGEFKGARKVFGKWRVPETSIDAWYLRQPVR